MTSITRQEQEAVDQLSTLNLKDKIGEDPYKKIGLALSQDPDLVSALNRCARDEFEHRNYNATIYTFKAILDFLSDHDEYPDKKAILLDTIIALAQLVDYHHELYPSLKSHLETGLEISIQLNDLRKQILIILNLGLYYCAAGRHEEGYQFFPRGFDMADKLGDRDILLRTEFYRGFFSLLQGRLQEGIAYFERILSYDLITLGFFSNFNVIAHLYTAYAYAGEYYQAINLMKSNIKYAEQIKDHTTLRICRFYLCWGLLMSGQLNEAMKELEGLGEDRCECGFLPLPINRTKAYYWYFRGDYQKAHQLLCKDKVSDTKIANRRINFPFIYELLLTFKNQGFGPIPGYDDLDALMERRIQGKNIVLRGLVWRIKAKSILLYEDEPDSKKVWRCFKNSAHDLKASGSRIELAKTRAEMAMFQLKKGETKLARKLAILAWSSISLYENLPFPEELLSLINVQPIKCPQASGHDVDLYVGFFDMLQKLTPSESKEEVLGSLLSRTARFFGADNGCIFEFTQPGDMAPELSDLSYNLDVIKHSKEQFEWVVTQAKKSHGAQTAQVFSIPDFHVFDNVNQGIHALFIPFTFNKEFFGVLYLGNMFANSIINRIDVNILLKLLECLSNYVDNQWRFFSRSKSDCLSAIGRVTNGIKVFDNSGSIYYGTSQQLTEQASRLASSNATILVLGETGVGKNHLAHLLHDFSNRKEMPFIHVNISGLSDNLVESELFGYEKGAFTGADRQKVGLIELANNGTLFIDEVGDIPKSIQIKLLQVLEEKTVVRVGGVIPRKIDFRLIAATNHDLIKAVEKGDFREDLYYRLCVVPLVIQPLRERENEIIKLANTFLKYYAKKYKISTPQLSPENEIELRCYHWPGNIRELKNIIEQAVLLSEEGQLRFQIPRNPNLKKVPRPKEEQISSFTGRGRPTLDELQRQYIQQVLAETRGQIGGENGAAKILGMKRTTLYNRMEKLGIRRKGEKAFPLRGKLNT